MVDEVVAADLVIKIDQLVDSITSAQEAFKVGMDRIAEASEEATRQSEEHFKEMSDKFSEAMESMKEQAKEAGETIKQGLEFIGIGVGLKEFIDIAVEAQFTEAQLDAGFKAVANTIGLTRGALDELADSLSRTTIYSNDTVKGAEAMLTIFGKVRGEAFEQTIKVAADLAAKMGTDLTSATFQLGRALEDPEHGLSRLRRAGIIFTESQIETIKAMSESGDAAKAQALILDLVEQKTRGAAAAAKDTLGGALQSLRNAFEDSFESGKETTTGLQAAFQALADDMATHASEVQDTFGAALNFIGKAAITLVYGFKQLGTVIAGVLAGTAQAVQGNFSEARTIFKEMSADLDDLVARGNKAMEALDRAKAKKGEGAEGGGGPKSASDVEVGGFSKKELEVHLEYMKLEYEAMAKDSQERIDMAARILAFVTNAYGKDSTEYFAALRERLSAAQQFEEAKLKLHNAEGSTFEGLEKEMTKTMEKESEERLKAGMKEVQARIDGYDNIKKANEKLRQDYAKNFEKMFEPLTRSFSQAATGVLQGTQTLRQAFLRLGDGLLAAMVDTSVKGLIHWVANERAKTAATQIGNVERAAADKEGAQQGMLEHAKAALKQIGNDALSAGAGAYKAVVGIPFVGPILAPIAAATAFTAVVAYESGIASAAGGMMVDRDQIAKVHENEMILPAKITKGLMGMIGEGSGGGAAPAGGGDIHLHGQFVDIKGFSGWLKQNSSVLSPALRDLNARFAR